MILRTLHELQIINQNKNPWPKGWRVRPIIMGIINITPDSFSDGGSYIDPEDALLKAKEFIEVGVDLIDIGGQSTRPGAGIISPEEELNRVVPVLKLLRRELPETFFSIDTYYSLVAEEALNIGVNWVNDISGGRLDPEILNVVANSNVPFVITHSRGNSLTMNLLSKYQDVTSEVYSELMINVEKAISLGVSYSQIILDPGLGFAKNNEHNLCLLYNLEKFTQTRFPVLVGPSRKRFIGHILNETDPNKRIFGTAAVVCRCVEAKVSVLRVHDVKEISQTILMAESLWPKN